MSSTSEEQVLRYAADLASLYAKATEDRERLSAVEDDLARLSGVCLELVSSLSLADAGRRLAQAAVQALGLGEAAVYVVRKNRFALLAQTADAAFPGLAPVSSDDLATLNGEPDEMESLPWTALTGGVRAAVVPLRGRSRTIGFLVGAGSLPYLHAPEGFSHSSLLTLLAGHAGIVLENHLLDERRTETHTTRAVRAQPRHPGSAAAELLGSSACMQEVLHLVRRLAAVDSSVVLTGETGTGKTLVARLIHESGPRSAAPFVTLNCAAIPAALVESELFGHEVGAFTGALRKHRGRVEQAEGGTLFLDEVGELPLEVQSKLLTFVEERRYSRVGGEKELAADVRLISATNTDLDAAAADKTFRSDLLFRLNVFTIELPPLNRRGADILALACALGQEVATRYGLPEPAFDSESEARLLSYSWPGNVRELRNVVEKAVILAEGGPIPAQLLPKSNVACQGAPDEDTRSVEAIDTSVSFTEAKAKLIERWEVAYIQTLLRMTSGNVARAARLAKIDKKNLHRKIKRYGIDLDALRD